MSISNLFNKDSEEVREMFFAIKLIVNTTGIKDEELKNLLKSLRKRHDNYFKWSNNQFSAKTSSGFILDQKNNRDIYVSPESIEYREKKLFNKENFNNICKMLYEFYLETKNVEPEDIKLIGKVWSLRYGIEQNVIEVLKRKTGLFKDNDLSSFEIRTNLFENEKNIHIYFRNITSDDGQNLEDILAVRLDINNTNQEEGLKDNSFTEILDFADIFMKDRLIDILNKNFNV